MPNIKSAKKRVLVAEKKAAANKAVKTQMKTQIKKFLAAVEAGDIFSGFLNSQLYKICGSAYR